MNNDFTFIALFFFFTALLEKDLKIFKICTHLGIHDLFNYFFYRSRDGNDSIKQ